MSHEPECPTASCLCDENEDCMECVCVCDNLAAAYQRGREDAAKAVEALDPSGEFDARPWVQELTWWVEQAVAVAVARGDGEQA